MTHRPIELLLIEDNPADVLLVRRSLTRGRVLNLVHHRTTGEEGLAFLRARVADGQRPPDLVLLDLKLPGMSGEDVLEAIRADPATADVKVVVLTTSAADDAVIRSFSLRADAFVVKPLDAEQLFAITQALDGFALSFVRADPTS